LSVCVFIQCWSVCCLYVCMIGIGFRV
jgi:hypothetical protein